MISAIIGKYALPFVGGVAVVSLGLTVALVMNRDRLKSEIAALIGAGVEATYWLAKRHGWRT